MMKMKESDGLWAETKAALSLSLPCPDSCLRRGHCCVLGSQDRNWGHVGWFLPSSSKFGFPLQHTGWFCSGVSTNVCSGLSYAHLPYNEFIFIVRQYLLTQDYFFKSMMSLKLTANIAIISQFHKLIHCKLYTLRSQLIFHKKKKGGCSMVNKFGNVRLKKIEEARALNTIMCI